MPGGNGHQPEETPAHKQALAEAVDALFASEGMAEVDIAELRRAESDAAAPPPPECTDTRNAERLAEEHGHDLRYCHPWKKWLAWDGTRWRPDDTAEAIRRAKQTVRKIAQDALEDEDDKHRSMMLGWAAKSEEARRRDNMLRLAQAEPGIPVRPAELDRNPWLLNCENGTLDLRTGALRPPARADLITKLAPVAYDPAALCPTWDAFLGRIFDADAGLVGFMQRACGYILTGDVSAEVAFFLVGAGANGKTTLLRSLQDMLGDYAAAAPSDLLVADDKGKGGATPERMLLKGARLAVCQETAEGKALNAATMKQVTSRDLISARALYQDACEFEATHKLFLGTNHKPRVRSTDEGTWRRLLLIPFNLTIPAEERDPHMLEHLEAERAGVLAWAVRGCLEWQAKGGGMKGLDPSPAVLEATASYRQAEDVLGVFLADRCVIGPQDRVSKPEMMSAYQAWCTEMKETPLSSKTFGNRLMELPGITSRKSGSTRWWFGIGLEVVRDARDASEVFTQLSPTRAHGEELRKMGPIRPTCPQTDWTDPDKED